MARTGRLSVVNGLRGLAIIGVLFHHLGSDWFGRHSGAAPGWILALITNGWTGVNLFFILSGFVLFLPYAEGRRHLAGWADTATFYRHRFWRLMPLYYFVVLVLLAVGAAGLSRAAFANAARQLLLLGFVVNRYGFMPPLNYPLWSIGVEILFSLSFPLLVVLVARLGLARVLGLALVAALVARVAGRLWNPEPLGPNFISDNIPGRIDEFVLGMATAGLYARDRIPRWAPRLAWPGIGLILVAWEGFYRCQYRGLPTVVMSPLNDVLDAGFCCVLLGALAREQAGRSALAVAPLQVIGMMCYSIYIWHGPVLSAVVPIAGAVPALLLVLVLAMFTYRYIEFGRERDWRTLFLWPAVVGRAPVTVGAPTTARLSDAP
ncbi:MAG: acyltransferase [Proteobacteria bacterium]|nr:acyltransferase [Pseudomonadota bacterium]